jgi:protein arginine N-methyltransferase 1
MESDKNQLGQFIPKHYHFQMLSDNNRLSAFKKAIEETVKPGDRVVDLGSGTGVLSFLAARQGAQVRGIEFNPALVEASRTFISGMNLSEKIQIIEADAASYISQEPIDVVICEMLHSALLREKQLEVLVSFCENHHKEFGRKPILLPCATILAVQPVFQTYSFEGYYAPISLFQSAYQINEDCIIHGEPLVYQIIDYLKVKNTAICADLNFSFSEPCTVNALRFITKNILSIQWKTHETTDWHSQHLVIPLERPYHFSAGDRMNIKFMYSPGASIHSLEKAIAVVQHTHCSEAI